MFALYSASFLRFLDMGISANISINEKFDTNKNSSLLYGRVYDINLTYLIPGVKVKNFLCHHKGQSKLDSLSCP